MSATTTTTAATTTITAKQVLADYIRQNGPIPTVRVSSAQAKGRAKRYCYWGIVRYEIALAKDGTPKHVALERAASERRSRRLAELDAERLAKEEGSIVVWFASGKLSDVQCEYVLSVLGLS